MTVTDLWIKYPEVSAAIAPLLSYVDDMAASDEKADEAKKLWNERRMIEFEEKE